MSASLLENLRLALAALKTSLESPVLEARDLSGIIKDFELSYELAWKVLKKSLEVNGHPVSSAREAFEAAYQLGWLADESVWLAMINDRNLSVHTYNRSLAEAMTDRIRRLYFSSLQALSERLSR